MSSILLISPSFIISTPPPPTPLLPTPHHSALSLRMNPKCILPSFTCYITNARPLLLFLFLSIFLLPFSSRAFTKYDAHIGLVEPERSETERGSESPVLALSAGAHTVFLLEREVLGMPRDVSSRGFIIPKLSIGDTSVEDTSVCEHIFMALIELTDLKHTLIRYRTYTRIQESDILI